MVSDNLKNTTRRSVYFSMYTDIREAVHMFSETVSCISDPQVYGSPPPSELGRFMVWYEHNDFN